VSRRFARRLRPVHAIFGSLVLMFSMGITSFIGPAAPAGSNPTTFKPNSIGELDCNGQSRIQKPVRVPNLCTDIRGIAGVNNANTWGGRFYDNNMYIGHDEPDMTFVSSAPGSGNDVSWQETLGTDPAGAATVTSPGSDVAHWVELTAAPWFSMAICDSNSYPQLPCTPNNDINAPACEGPSCPQNSYPGAGSAFMELQFYPPGFAPFVDAPSCDNTHWCAALTIDSLECTFGFAQCNPNCIEPVNFAWIQTDGVPTGPPSPQQATINTDSPNAQTLLMNRGDQVRVHMFDAPAPGGGNAFKAVVDDLTTHVSGFMQASAANGFAHTSIVDCSGTPFNFEPEYNTAAKSNYVPWAALQTDISTEFEIGHFTPCTRVTNSATLGLPSGLHDTYWSSCQGPYEKTAPGGDGSGQPEVSDALCYPKGDTHGVLHSAPDTMTGCLDDLFQNGDLDFDGTAYWPEWPTGPAPTGLYPGSFVQALPTTHGNQYPSMFIQTDTALSESTCSGTSTTGCAVPPPQAPGKFYPYWSRVSGSDGSCTVEFGNVHSGLRVDDFGRDAQYGTDQIATLGYPEFEGPVQPSGCSPGSAAA
jgi:hypothetical protein